MRYPREREGHDAGDHGHLVLAAVRLREDTARTHAALAGVAGVAAATAVGWLVEGGRRLAVRRLMARRFRRWGAAWARAGQDWGRADAGS
ncbi:hypothetical protein ACH4VR_30545 [Streptomyces sp. NPDC020883]|uniref:hypothetical protein n=1 Tax=Streptomyces sp. NPDC020883 TaxID=3365099 RepID=UPI00379F5FF8